MSDSVTLIQNTPVETTITVTHPVSGVQTVKVTDITQSVSVLTVGVPGPQGARGAKGETLEVVASIEATALTAIGGHRVVNIYNNQASYASRVDNYSGVLAFTKDAIELGALGTFYTSGLIEEPTWNFTAGFVYLDINGLLTQSKPTSGTVIIIGKAVNPTSLFLQIQQLYRRV